MTSKVTRISDYYFPDPKHFPGVYPYSMINPYQINPLNYCHGVQPLILDIPTHQKYEFEKNKKELLDSLKNKKNKTNAYNNYKFDKFASIKKLIHDVDEISNERDFKLGRNLSALSKSGNNIINDNNFSNINYQNKFNNFNVKNSLNDFRGFSNLSGINNINNKFNYNSVLNLTMNK